MASAVLSSVLKVNRSRTLLDMRGLRTNMTGTCLPLNYNNGRTRSGHGFWMMVWCKIVNLLSLTSQKPQDLRSLPKVCDGSLRFHRGRYHRTVMKASKPVHSFHSLFRIVPSFKRTNWSRSWDKTGRYRNKSPNITAQKSHHPDTDLYSNFSSHGAGGPSSGNADARC